MKELRKLIRLNVSDFLDIRLVDSPAVVKGKCVNVTSMGICFSSPTEWVKGQSLVIYYFIPEELDSVELTVKIIWSEFVDSRNGYFCGGEIAAIEEAKQEKFINYYMQKLEDRFSR